MSQQMVEIVVDRLLSDEDARVRFARDRFRMLAELGFRGIELTSDELDVLIQTDARVWFGFSLVLDDRVH
jgi:hypothetical protein